MNLTIEIPDEIVPTLNAEAQAHGVTAARYVSSMTEKEPGAGQPERRLQATV